MSSRSSNQGSSSPPRRPTSGSNRSPSASSSPRSSSNTVRTPSNQGIPPLRDPPSIRRRTRVRRSNSARVGNDVRSSGSSGSSNNQGVRTHGRGGYASHVSRESANVNRLVRRLLMTNESLNPSSFEGGRRKRARVESAWRRRVRTVPIPTSVPAENRTALFTNQPVRRGIPCKQCKKFLAKSNFRGLVRKQRPCPYCRYPFRKENFESPPSRRKRSPQ